MAGHYFYDPRPYYGLNQTTNLMPLDELFYKYEPVPYWMDQRMAAMATYPNYHPGHAKQVMTRGPEVQQLQPSNRPELAVRDDIYTDIYKRSPHFNSFAPYPQPRGVSQDDSWVHAMAPQFANPQNQFPQQGRVPYYGYGVPMPMQMGYLGNTTGHQQPMRQADVPMHGHMSSQKMPNANCNGEQYGQIEVTNKGSKNPGANNNGNGTKSSNNNDVSYGNVKSSKQMYGNDDGDGNKSKKEAYNNNDGYGNMKSSKQTSGNDDGCGNKSKKETYNNNDGYGNMKSSKQMSCNDGGYGNMTSSKQGQSNDSSYGNKSKESYNNDDGYGSKKSYNNDESYSNKSNGNTNYGVGTKQGNAKQQQRYTNDDSSSDDEDEVGGGRSGAKWGTKPLLKHSKSDTYSHGKKFDHEMAPKKSEKGSQYGGNMVVYDSGKKQSGHKSGSQSKTGYQNGGDSSSDEDERYAYTKQASKSGLHNQGITKVQHSHGNGGMEQSTRGLDSHAHSVGQQPKHMQFQSQSKSVELKVPLCCDNCERKVTACLEYVDGVESVLCDQWQKKVIVYGNVRPDVVLKRVRKVKKASELWQQANRVPVY